MPDQASIKFAHAHKALCKAADKNPEYFDLARDVLRRHDNGSVTLLHALMQGLQEAYEAGSAGLPVPLPTLVQTSAELRSLANYSEPQAATSPVKRVARSVPASAPVTTPKRVVRRAP